MAVTPMLDGYIPLEDILESLGELYEKEIEKEKKAYLKSKEKENEKS
ncbi:Uncharacterised protein [Staphylococcus piscifermentans]|uniref:Uncharacterized protein n=1 Tax=Staphylococcus piscifermentans TaxID=70258 RepID=A0A239UEI8_9STAP|nr:hypothetical protein [Staphylococcus piscifermentans]GEP84009.1 hypothetical protein SPI02_05940 [Staphylococcus piscifermentans]SNV07514.1 Uncharacterised protein [Staphylococcus piscifermentans]